MPPYEKTSEITMENSTNIIILVATFVIVLFITISDSKMQSKVATVTITTMFTTVIIGLYMGKHLITDPGSAGWYQRLILYITLCLTVIVPQMKYMTVVMKKSDIIYVPAQLPYNGTVTSLTFITMLFAILGIYVANNNKERVQSILMKTLVGCTFLGGLSYSLVGIMSERLDKMNANVLNELKESVATI